MFIFALSGFINGILALIFGGLVYFKNRKEKVNQIFGLLSISVAIFGLSYGIWQISDNKETALFWVRMLNFGAVFIPIFFLHCVIVLLELERKEKKILIFGYLLTLIFAIFSFSPLYIKDVKPELYFPWWPKPGVLYPFYIILGYFGLSGYSFYLLFKNYRKAAGIKRKQIKYFAIGALIGLGGGATNFPLWYGVPFPPYGNFLIFLYPLIDALAVVKYRLFEIKLILTEVLVVMMGVILALLPFLLKTFQMRIFTIGIVLVYSIIGYLLIKTTYKEIEKREEIKELTKELKKLNKNLEKKVKERTKALEFEKKLANVHREIAEERTRSIEEIYKRKWEYESIIQKLQQKIDDLEKELKKKKKRKIIF